MKRVLKHCWFTLALLALSIAWAVRIDEPLGWFVCGFNGGVAFSVILFVASRYGRIRFPD